MIRIIIVAALVGCMSGIASARTPTIAPPKPTAATPGATGTRGTQTKPTGVAAPTKTAPTTGAVGTSTSSTIRAGDLAAFKNCIKTTKSVSAAQACIHTYVQITHPRR
jgi:hypothetical protein